RQLRKSTRQTLIRAIRVIRGSFFAILTSPHLSHFSLPFPQLAFSLNEADRAAFVDESKLLCRAQPEKLKGPVYPGRIKWRGNILIPGANPIRPGVRIRQPVSLRSLKCVLGFLDEPERT